MKAWRVAAGAGLLLLAAPAARAQSNYEIQVYGSETMAPKHAIFEIHSNYTVNGRRTVANGVNPTWHALHETLEVTHGVTAWSELGYYLFTSARTTEGFQVIGTHLRPRVMAPKSWNWPVGASLSAEFGFQKREFSEDTWSIELRPIIDKDIGRFYFSFNPTVERALKSDGKKQFAFVPNIAVAVDVTQKVNFALEYYGGFGPVTNPLPGAQQEHILFEALNLYLSPDWEINFGVGQGFRAADQAIVKLLLGRRVSWK